MRLRDVPQNFRRRILKDATRDNEQRDRLYHRAVARLLRKDGLRGVPWQRIVGAGGEIKLRGEAAAEQRLRLSMEGVKFRGKRVNMQLAEHTFRGWETLDR
jgi:methylated-DNA-protein-cysteine methyltransferase related protein